MIRKTLEIIAVLSCILFIRSAVAATFFIPSASMEPTLQIGDRVVALMPSYGLSTANLPFGGSLRFLSEKRLFGRLPHRGDIVIFRAPAEPQQSWIKRVVALPGDHVALQDGHVLLNGVMLPWIDRGADTQELRARDWKTGERYEEYFPNGKHHAVFKLSPHGDYDTLPEFTVPAGSLFVMGDNRDDSADSRIPVAEGGVGLLPLWNLQGQAIETAFSLRRLARFLHTL